jgi:hypothetical protein
MLTTFRQRDMRPREKRQDRRKDTQTSRVLTHRTQLTIVQPWSRHTGSWVLTNQVHSRCSKVTTTPRTS